jgi:hypothetical protein
MIKDLMPRVSSSGTRTTGQPGQSHELLSGTWGRRLLTRSLQLENATRGRLAQPARDARTSGRKPTRLSVALSPAVEPSQVGTYVDRRPQGRSYSPPSAGTSAGSGGGVAGSI